MPMVEIDDAVLANLRADSIEKAKLESENNKLKETAENTAKALKEHRDTEKTLKETISNLEKTVSEKETELTSKIEELDSIKESADKWNSHIEAEQQARLDNIEKLKTDLGDKFNDEVKGFIEDLPDEKVEAYLTSLAPKDEGKKPPVTTDPAGGQSGAADTSAFDTAAQSNDIDGMLAALNTNN